MKIKSELRNEDEKCSEIVSDFLDLLLYSNLEDVERIYNKEEQVKGIDIKFTKDNKRYLCDEKAAIRYVNKPLKTYAFELSFFDRGGHLEEGWLISPKKINNSFMCIWIDYADKDLITDIRDIKDLEIALIDRDKLLNYLKSIGWDRRKMLRKSKRIREDKKENLGDMRKNGCRFTISRQLVETPVNILLPREKVIELSDYHQRFLRKE